VRPHTGWRTSRHHNRKRVHKYPRSLSAPAGTRPPTRTLATACDMSRLLCSHSPCRLRRPCMDRGRRRKRPPPLPRRCERTCGHRNRRPDRPPASSATGAWYMCPRCSTRPRDAGRPPLRRTRCRRMHRICLRIKPAPHRCRGRGPAPAEPETAFPCRRLDRAVRHGDRRNRHLARQHCSDEVRRRVDEKRTIPERKPGRRRVPR